jgi:hypothetical protein
VADDFSELYVLAADLSDAPANANRLVKKALEVTARFIKDDARQQADRTGLSGYAASIDYDITYPGGAIEANIGPNLGRNQGSFGFLEDATGDVRSAPQHALRDALRANEPDFIRGLEIAVFDAVTGA